VPPAAASVTLRLGALNCTVTTVGTNQFRMQLAKGSAGPSSVLVLAPGGVTTYQGFSSSSGPVQAGQIVAVRQCGSVTALGAVRRTPREVEFW